MTRSHKVWLTSILLSLVFAAYQLTAAKEIGWVDSGLLTAAAKTLGIPNPPGFPSYLIIGHLFTLIPWGSTVWQLQLLSQLSALGITIMTFLFIWYVSPKGRQFIPSLVGSLSLAFSYNLWSQANNIETYTLTNFALISLLFWLFRSIPTNLKPIQLMILGLLSGLSLGLNPTIIALIPAACWWVYYHRKFYFTKPALLILPLIAATLGAFLVYSYLPLRASTHPFINWGDPVTLDRIRTHLVGGGLNIYEPQTNSVNGFTWEPSIFLESFLRYLYLAFYQFTPLLLPFIFWGGWQIYRKSQLFFGLSISIILSNLTMVVLYYGGNQESWMISSWLIFAVYLGVGIAHLPAKYNIRWLLLLPLIPLFFWYPILDRSDNTYARTYAQILYRDLPANAVIIGGGDFFNSLTTYTHEVDGLRKDIIPITGNMFYIFPWYRQTVSLHSDLVISPELENLIRYQSVDEFTTVIDKLIADNPDHSFFITPLLLRDSVVAGTKDGTYHTTKYHLIPHGLLLRVANLSETAPPNLDLYDFPLYTQYPYYLERNYKNAYKLLHNDYAVAYAYLGEYYAKQNNNQQAEAYFLKAYEYSHRKSSEFSERLAIFYAQLGQRDAAEQYFLLSLSRDPDKDSLKQNYDLFHTQTATDSAVSTTPPSDHTTYHSPSLNLSFSYPSDWQVSETKQIIKISNPSGNFIISLSKDVRGSQTIDDYLSSHQPTHGTILEQGLAKIPGSDLAYVRVLSQGSATDLEFFLFKSNLVIQVIVGPPDSPDMKIFDNIISTLNYD